MARRLIGTGITNAQGIAIMNKDAQGETITGYTGVGAGKLQIIAESGTLQSETYELLDCYKYDSGMLDYSNIWTVSGTATLSRDTQYSTITENTSETTAYVTIGNIALTSYRIEVDVYQVDGTQDEWSVTVLTSDYSSITSVNSKLGEWKHISIDLTDIEANSRIRVNTGGSCTELRFKNFKVYPI